MRPPPAAAAAAAAPPAAPAGACWRPGWQDLRQHISQVAVHRPVQLAASDADMVQQARAVSIRAQLHPEAGGRFVNIWTLVDPEASGVISCFRCLQQPISTWAQLDPDASEVAQLWYMCQIPFPRKMITFYSIGKHTLYDQYITLYPCILAFAQD
eukprot:scaffold3920_cov22-Tisochrysis_lutea.AAC.1